MGICEYYFHPFEAVLKHNSDNNNQQKTMFNWSNNMLSKLQVFTRIGWQPFRLIFSHDRLAKLLNLVDHKLVHCASFTLSFLCVIFSDKNKLHRSSFLVLFLWMQQLKLIRKSKLELSNFLGQAPALGLGFLLTHSCQAQKTQNWHQLVFYLIYWQVFTEMWITIT